MKYQITRTEIFNQNPKSSDSICNNDLATVVGFTFTRGVRGFNIGELVHLHSFNVNVSMTKPQQLHSLLHGEAQTMSEKKFTNSLFDLEVSAEVRS